MPDPSSPPDAEALRLLVARLEERLASLQQDLDGAERMEALGRLTLGISHDMKNVLQLVLGHGELLRRRMPPEPRLRLGVDQIIAAAERGARSSEAIQEYARSHQPPRQQAPLSDLVREAFASLAPPIPAGVSVELRLDDPGPIVLVDRRAIRQAVLYVVSRAAGAVPEGGLIEVLLASEPGRQGELHATLTIRDSGVAMTPEQIARVRHPFEGAWDAVSPGILDLAVAERIFRDHGGTLELASPAGSGTTVHCTLPVSVDSN